MNVFEACEKAETIEGYAGLLEQAIMCELPDCRERSIALTKLDECQMWARRYLVDAYVLTIKPDDRAKDDDGMPTTAAEFLRSLVEKEDGRDG